MVYFIFFKSLRSLEGFRKNPHIQIPSKFRCKIPQSLAKNPNSFEIQKSIPFKSSLWDPAHFTHTGPLLPAGHRLPHRLV
jgi:hypothetical protein